MSYFKDILSILVLLMLLSNVQSAGININTSTSKASTVIPQHYTCENQINRNNVNDDKRPLNITWITGSRNVRDNIGILETPNFPKRFPLPLRCVWIFNNTVPINGMDKSNLFIYFTRVIL